MSNSFIGIIIKLISVTVVFLLALCVKTFPDDAPVSQLMFFRVSLSIPFVLSYAYWQSGSWAKTKIALTPKRFSLHVRRAFMGMTGMGLTFLSLQLLPLPIAQAIRELTPVLITLLAVFLLGEKIRFFRSFGLFLGLFGVSLITYQTLVLNADLPQSDLRSLGVFAALGAAFAIALTQIHIRSMVATENPTAIVFWFFIITMVVTFCFLPFGWIWPTAQGWKWLFFIGLFGAAGQLTLTTAYKFADASTVAPFEYFSIPLSLIVGAVFFDEIPSPLAMIGIAFILAGGLIIIYREGQLARKNRSARQNDL